jgi:hypothetical protein
VIAAVKRACGRRILDSAVGDCSACHKNRRIASRKNDVLRRVVVLNRTVKRNKRSGIVKQYGGGGSIIGDCAAVNDKRTGIIYPHGIAAVCRDIAARLNFKRTAAPKRNRTRIICTPNDVFAGGDV